MNRSTYEGSGPEEVRACDHRFRSPGLAVLRPHPRVTEDLLRPRPARAFSTSHPQLKEGTLMRRFTPIHTLAFTVLFAMSICAPVLAQDDNSQSHGNTLEGVWQVT